MFAEPDFAVQVIGPKMSQTFVRNAVGANFKTRKCLSDVKSALQSVSSILEVLSREHKKSRLTFENATAQRLLDPEGCHRPNW